ncbi:MAG: DUF3109 family protein [Candidatus Cryptobacteroides sp.]|nr:DUF3109 family protein [Bacteroidales bacterium]
MSRNERFGTIFEIGDCLVSEEIVTEYFACDYEKCRGCCCIIGDSGAPLAEDEVEKIEEAYPEFSPLMRESGRKVVAEKGFFEIDVDGDVVTPLSPGTEECAYTHFDENGNCFCSIERCWFSGKCKFRKPASCWLYPIRVTELTGGRHALNLHRWNICRDAFENGKKKKVRVYEFLREPLTSVYGEEFYSALSFAASKFLAES